jgi:hypothetical protein
MARQFREQLEEEVQLEEARKAKPVTPAPPPAAESAAAAGPPAAPPPAAAEPNPLPPTPPTFSHAHATDETGADTSARGAPVSADEQRT